MSARKLDESRKHKNAKNAKKESFDTKKNYTAFYTISISKILIKKISQLYNIIQCLRKNGNIIFIYCIMKLIR